MINRNLWPFDLAEQPQQRVKFILGDECDEEHVSHEVFTELEELTVGEDGEEQTWKEMARWEQGFLFFREVQCKWLER